jgi:sugar lactone lactonase YvrE
MALKKVRNMMTGRSIRLGAILMSVLFVSLLVTWGLTRSDSQVIQTIAGTGSPGYSGDGGRAVEATLNTMQGLLAGAIDSNGNLYIADTNNHVVRRIDATGVITTVAGLGPDQAGFNGDNQPATQAKLAAPSDVALDAAGNLYIADNGNGRIRKVDGSGIITTVAGGGGPGDGLGDGGPATAAKLINPSGITFDSAGNLYVSEAGRNRIRRVDIATGIITTLAGTSGFGFGGDGGPATAATFKSPVGMAFGPDGALYVADSQNHRIRRIGADGIITTVVNVNGTFQAFSPQDLKDGGLAVDAVVRLPMDVAFDRMGNWYIAENGSNRIRRVDTAGIITTVAGSGDPRVRGCSGDGGEATSAQLNGPSGVVVDTQGNIYISDSGCFRVRKVNAQ